MFILIAVVAVLLVPIAWVMNHSATWGPAEYTADVLHSLAGDILKQNLTESEIVELLKSPNLKHHGIHEFHADIENSLMN
jgi:hypothetical protein